MTASMREYLSVGLISFMAFPETMGGEGPVLSVVEQIARDDYFDAIEISWIKDPAIRRQAADILAASHLQVCYGASPRLLTTGLNVNDLDPQGRERALSTLLTGIDEAYEMGAQGFSYLSGKYAQETKEQAFEALVDSTRRMCAYAAEKGGMEILLEIFDYDVDKCSLIGPTPLARRFAEAMREQPNFGLLVDLSHIPLMHETIEESLYPVKDYIRHAHMGNAVVTPGLPAYGDVHPRFGFPGGSNDIPQLAAYLRALIDIGYLKKGAPRIVSFEVKPFGAEDPLVIIANSKRTLNAAWALV